MMSIEKEQINLEMLEWRNCITEVQVQQKEIPYLHSFHSLGTR